MKYVASLTALALASAAVIALAAPEGAAGPRHHGGGMERLKQADTDGNGMISRDEAKALPMIAKHFDEIDTNKDNQLSPDELRAFHEKMRATHAAERFKKLDTDGDGKVSLAEAKANAPRLAEHFSEIDTNGDGFITPEEMKAAHERHGKGRK
jgi:Ca2+-binding EF-hand superfamily protein